MRYVVLHDDKSLKEVTDVRIALTSFINDVAGLAKILKDVVLESVFRE